MLSDDATMRSDWATVPPDLLTGETGRECEVSDQHQAVHGQPAGPQCGGGGDVPAGRGRCKHRSPEFEIRREALQQGHPEI